MAKELWCYGNEISRAVPRPAGAASPETGHMFLRNIIILHVHQYLLWPVHYAACVMTCCMRGCVCVCMCDQ